MGKFGYGLALLVVCAWVGGLWATGYLAVPLLFHDLSDKQLAGMLAGKMLTAIAYVGLASAFYLVVYLLSQSGIAAFKQTIFRVVVVMLLLTMAGQFGFQPILADLKAQALPADVMQSTFAPRFRTWHGVASITYLVQCILGIILVLKIRR